MCACLFRKSCPKSNLWLLFDNTNIFIFVLKVPIDIFPLMTPSILLFVEFIPITLSCSDGSKFIMSWILNISSLPMRDIWDPVSTSICMVMPLRVPFREKSCSMGVMISPSGVAAAFAIGVLYVLFGCGGGWLLGG